MIKEKKSNAVPVVPEPTPEPAPVVSVPEQEQLNPLAEMYYAVRRAILTIPERSSEPGGEPFFKTVAIDTGQFERLVRSENTETEIPLPAVFIHYTNVRYLVQQQRIGEGRATMRVRFILNTLNNQDPERECDPFHVFQLVNQAIQDAKNHEPALNERCQTSICRPPPICSRRTGSITKCGSARPRRGSTATGSSGTSLCLPLLTTATPRSTILRGTGITADRTIVTR